MKSSLQLAAVFALSIAHVQALPPSSPPSAVGDLEGGMRIMQIDVKDDKVFTMYENEVAGNTTSPDLEARQFVCADNTRTCNGGAGGSHFAPKDSCQLLIDSLEPYPVPNSPRSYCLNYNNGRCCLSWGSVPPEGTAFKMFQDTANSLADNCGNNADNTVSGKESSASINGGCVPVCLSSRPDGC